MAQALETWKTKIVKELANVEKLTEDIQRNRPPLSCLCCKGSHYCATIEHATLQHVLDANVVDDRISDYAPIRIFVCSSTFLSLPTIGRFRRRRSEILFFRHRCTVCLSHGPRGGGASETLQDYWCWLCVKQRSLFVRFCQRHRPHRQRTRSPNTLVRFFEFTDHVRLLRVSLTSAVRRPRYV